MRLQQAVGSGMHPRRRGRSRHPQKSPSRLLRPALIMHLIFLRLSLRRWTRLVLDSVQQASSSILKYVSYLTLLMQSL